MNRERISQEPLASDPDPVELASLDSFPASDPPSWIRLHPGRPATSAVPESSGQSDPQEIHARAEDPAGSNPAGKKSEPDPAMTNRLRPAPSC